MLAVVVCERMAWDYQTYLAQPNWFIELVVRKLEIDAKERQRASQKARYNN